MKADQTQRAVRQRYGQRARGGGPCCDGLGCCDTKSAASKELGYTDEQLNSLPEGADLGLGCGNPLAFASPKEGDVVLDLGSGAGIDCFLTGQAVGESGRAIGVDMTPEMIERARDNARRSGVSNVEFRLGEIESLPVANCSVDIVVSNCVINLSSDKPRVFAEAYRALRPGGRMVVSDIVLLRELPPEIEDSVEYYVGCVAGASKKSDYLAAMHAAGFQNIRILKEVPADSAPSDSALQREGLGSTIVSITLEATKPD